MNTPQDNTLGFIPEMLQKALGINLQDVMGASPKAAPQPPQEVPTDPERVSLSASEEKDFQKWIKGTGWYKEYVRDYKEFPDLDAKEYDYRAAWKAGIAPERDPYDNNRYHWASSTNDGTMLKSKDHPTAWKEYFMRDHGKNPDELGVSKDAYEAMSKTKVKKY